MSLLRADAIIQSRHRPSILLSLLLPLCFLYNWKHLLPVLGPSRVLAGCISLALPALGLMGYSLVMARDRELGVFRRLRTTPCSPWMIIASRYIIQSSIMLVLSAITITAALYMDGIHTSAVALLRALPAIMLAGFLFLSLGQVIVSVCKTSESVNAATRLIYALILVAGLAAQTSQQSSIWHDILQWSPLGVAERVISDALTYSTVREGLLALFAVSLYTLILSAIGIRWFKWLPNA